MQPDRATKRKNCGNPADAAKHDCEASECSRHSQLLRFSGTKAPLPSSRYSVEPTREI